MAFLAAVLLLGRDCRYLTSAFGSLLDGLRVIRTVLERRCHRIADVVVEAQNMTHTRLNLR